MAQALLKTVVDNDLPPASLSGQKVLSVQKLSKAYARLRCWIRSVSTCTPVSWWR